MLGGNSPAASCAGLIGHPSVVRIFHREKFARARPLKFEGGAARARMSSDVGSDEHWCGRRDSNPHNFRHWNLNPARLPIPPRPQEDKKRSIKVGRHAAGGVYHEPSLRSNFLFASAACHIMRKMVRINGHGRSHFSTEPPRGDGGTGRQRFSVAGPGCPCRTGLPAGASLQGRPPRIARGSAGHARLVAWRSTSSFQARRSPRNHVDQRSPGAGTSQLARPRWRSSS